MKKCAYAFEPDEDMDDIAHPSCQRYPWRCIHFRPNIFCPFMKHWDNNKFREWKKWKWEEKHPVAAFISECTKYLFKRQ
jgi:hypothetical protein